ncbi:MAG: hypothetical protein ACO1RX_08650 [Candidatus Sericytochromatia bacterium]
MPHIQRPGPHTPQPVAPPAAQAAVPKAPAAPPVPPKITAPQLSRTTQLVQRQQQMTSQAKQQQIVAGILRRGVAPVKPPKLNLLKATPENASEPARSESSTAPERREATERSERETAGPEPVREEPQERREQEPEQERSPRDQEQQRDGQRQGGQQQQQQHRQPQQQAAASSESDNQEALVQELGLTSQGRFGGAKEREQLQELVKHKPTLGEQVVAGAKSMAHAAEAAVTSPYTLGKGLKTERLALQQEGQQLLNQAKTLRAEADSLQNEAMRMASDTEWMPPGPERAQRVAQFQQLLNQADTLHERAGTLASLGQQLQQTGYGAIVGGQLSAAGRDLQRGLRAFGQLTADGLGALKGKVLALPAAVRDRWNKPDRYYAAGHKLVQESRTCLQLASALRREATLNYHKADVPADKQRVERLLESAERLEVQAQGLQADAVFLNKAGDAFRFKDTAITAVTKGAKLGLKGASQGMMVANLVAESRDIVEFAGKAAARESSQHLVHGAQLLSAVGGAAAVVSVGVELYDGYQNGRKLAQGWTRKEEARALLMTPAERGKLADKLDVATQAAARELSLINRTKHPKRTAQLEATVQINTAKAKGLRDMNVRGVSAEAKAVAQQVHTRQGLGFKALRLGKNALAIAGGVMAALAAFGLAATPVGWALAGVALTAGIGLMAYSLGKKLSRTLKIRDLEGTQKDLLAKREQLRVEGHSRGVTPERKQEIAAELAKLAKVEGRLHLGLLAISPRHGAEALLAGLNRGNTQMRYLAETVLKIVPPERLLSMAPDDAVNYIQKHGLSLSPGD